MTIVAGTHLGSYEILAPIGSGGMGEVYRAHDTKLGRDVAIKVLPETFAHDPERLSRFQREAKMLASLNHPNIATIHGLEQSSATSYLVMELVSGETLQERIRRDGPVPVEEALSIAKQIADALEAAHEKGIIHRDLKPANVKLTPEGKVKVLDFGLAKAFAGDTASSNPAESPTLSAAATMQGVILGTAAYMSPEQARGKAVDKRADIWAFGCVLYELLTGKQAFQGETVTEILAAVLKGEPDWQALPGTTPLNIRALLRHCLQKDMNRRVRDAADVRIEIEDALAAPAGVDAAASPASGILALNRRALMFGLGALLSGLAIAILATWYLKPAPSLPARPVSRLVIALPSGDQLASLDQPAVALSSDGNHVAYVATRGGVQQIYLRDIDSLEAKPIPGTERANAPFFSPDDQWIGFFAEGDLKKVSTSGGPSITLCSLGGTANAEGPFGGSWGTDGTIVYFYFGLWQVSAAGGTPKAVTILAKTGETNHRWPAILPGGRGVLFAATTSSGDWANAQIAVRVLGTEERRNLISGGSRPGYAPSGHLVYAQTGTLMAVPFDLRRLEPTGSPVPVLEGVMQSESSGVAQYGFSDNGALVYVPGGVEWGHLKMAWVDRKGMEQTLAAHAYPYVSSPRISPDGRRIALHVGNQVWVYDLARQTSTRLTFQGNASYPVWTPDGKRIAFRSNKEGPENLFWQLADGSGGLDRLATSEYSQSPVSWSPDGQLLAFVTGSPTTGRDIWVLRMGDRKAQPFLRTPFDETAPRFSPDGRWLGYVSDESGRYEVYVQPYPGPGGKWQISAEGGTEPVWNPNGRELFYRSGDKMMAVDIVTQPGFAPGKPRMLFERPYLPSVGTLPNYDVSPDGQRFLMLKPTEHEQAGPTQINVVLNWFEELKHRVPTGK